MEGLLKPDFPILSLLALETRQHQHFQPPNLLPAPGSAVRFCPRGWTDRFLLHREAAPGAAQRRELQNCCSVQAFGDQVLLQSLQ